MEEKIKIAVLQDGPYLVKGEFLIIDAAGDEYPAVRRTVALCRCGGSANKPFCDGAHEKIGFQAAEDADGAVVPRGAWMWRLC